MELILQVNEKEHILNIADTNGKILNAFTETRSSFVKINGNIIKVDSSFFKDSKVSDCLFNIKNNKHKKLTPDKIKNNKIVLILESPHKDEFEKDTFKPLYPASGKTGERISTFFNEIVEKVEIENINEIIICNPVQWQSSIHELHKKGLTGEFKDLRDKVWCSLWESSQVDFCNRLRSYNADIIINACTIKLKTILHVFFFFFFSSKTKYLTNHPSSWNINRLRTIIDASSFHSHPGSIP